MREKIIFGAGCFWGVQHDFDRVPGVLRTTVGYSGGTRDRPTYRQVCTGNTGHAEVVLVEYEPLEVGLGKLLEVFWGMHDPTTPNRQGPDIGSQYRSAIYYFYDSQLQTINDSKPLRNYRRPIATEIKPAGKFWPAEDYHQKYFEKHGRRGCRI